MRILCSSKYALFRIRFDFSQNGGSYKICVRNAASRFHLRWKQFAAHKTFLAYLYDCQKHLYKIYALWKVAFSGYESVLMSKKKLYDGDGLRHINFVNNLLQVRSFCPPNLCFELGGVFEI